MENNHKSAKKAHDKVAGKRTKRPNNAAAKKRAAKRMSQTWNYDFVSPWA